MKRKPAAGTVAILLAVLAPCCGSAMADPSIVVEVSGLGHVVSDPPGISCPGTCRAEFPAFSDVKLHAGTDKEGKWLGWGGDCDSPTRSCKLYMNGEKIVQATFSVGL